MVWDQSYADGQRGDEKKVRKNTEEVVLTKDVRNRKNCPQTERDKPDERK